MFHWYWYFVYFIAIVHISHAVLTIYVHRGLIHGLLVFSKPLEHFFRFWLFFIGWGWPGWQKQFSALHRKHHRYSDQAQDPHSPLHFTFLEIVENKGVEPGKAYYLTTEEIEKYAHDIDNYHDWIQKNVYDTYSHRAPFVLFLLNFLLFGIVGGLIGIVLNFVHRKYLILLFGNYAVHKIGYSHPEGIDNSKNIFPIGILLAGEELHANHHNNPSALNWKQRWFEFDMGYVYIKIFEKLGLLTKKTNRSI